MATNLAIDDRLINEAKSVGKHKTKKEVRSRKRLGILKLAGQIEYYDDYDYKALRRKRPR